MTRRSGFLLVLLLLLGLLGPVPAATAGTSFEVVTKPTITGERRWDHTLTAHPGTWDPTPTRVTYQWLRDGSPINGANAATRKLTVADFGTTIAVKIRLHRDGYADVVATPSAGVIDHRVPVKRVVTYSIGTRGHVVTSTAVFRDLAADSYANPLGWRSAGIEFRRVAKGGDFTLVLADARSVPTFGYPCDHTWSCRVGRNVIINQTRWLHASPSWNAVGLPLRLYRDMVVNHETGHWLGHHHLGCPGKGQPAPLMMQQSKGLHGCRFNAFPLPSERWTTR